MFKKSQKPLSVSWIATLLLCSCSSPEPTHQVTLNPASALEPPTPQSETPTDPTEPQTYPAALIQADEAQNNDQIAAMETALRSISQTQN